RDLQVSIQCGLVKGGRHGPAAAQNELFRLDRLARSGSQRPTVRHVDNGLIGRLPLLRQEQIGNDVFIAIRCLEPNLFAPPQVGRFNDRFHDRIQRLPFVSVKTFVEVEDFVGNRFDFVVVRKAFGGTGTPELLQGAHRIRVYDAAEAVEDRGVEWIEVVVARETLGFISPTTAKNMPSSADFVPAPLPHVANDTVESARVDGAGGSNLLWTGSREVAQSNQETQITVDGVEIRRAQPVIN